jgi:hypothetical protein
MQTIVHHNTFDTTYINFKNVEIFNNINININNLKIKIEKKFRIFWNMLLFNMQFWKF